MHVLFVVNSELDNAATIAREIGAGFGPGTTVTVKAVGNVEQPLSGSYDAIVVGCAGRHRELQRWVNSLPNQRSLILAAFDVRDGAKVPRRRDAAAALTASLRRLGSSSVVRPRSFFETFSNGPLERGELGRAGDWGRMIAVLAGVSNAEAMPQIPAQRRRFGLTRAGA